MSTDRSFTIRRATLEDLDALVRHRSAMFSEMAVEGDYQAMEVSFRQWLIETMPDETYRAWVAEGEGCVVAGAGLVLHVKAPSPKSTATKKAFVYNVFVEPEWRGLGIARSMMETLHRWCNDNGVHHVSLHTSSFGRHLYESMGYEPTNELGLSL